MKVEGINTVCFIGAGTMGCFNSLMAAAAGYDAVIYDLSEEALNNTPHSLNGMAEYLSDQGFFAPETIPAALSRIKLTDDIFEAVSRADLISESVSERLAIKREVHRRLDEICKPDALITTNTSGLLVSEIEDVAVRGDRFAALHSHLGSIVFDVVGGPRTTAGSIDLLRRYVLSIGGLPLVLKKENPGYVINAMLGALLTVSQILVIEGVASKENIDRAWMQNQQAPIGPFGLMDLFGLNVVHDSWQHPRPQRAHLQAKILGFISPYIESGALGVKSGKGFYSYPEPAYSQPGFLTHGADLSLVYRVMICVLIANAIMIASDDVADPQEIDRAWMVSFSFPRGPFGSLDQMGIDDFLQTYLELVEQGIVPVESVNSVTDYLHPYIQRKTLGKKSGQGFYSYPNPEYSSADFLTVQ